MCTQCICNTAGKPVKVEVLIIRIMKLFINKSAIIARASQQMKEFLGKTRDLPAPLPTLRQQLVDAHPVRPILPCSSAAPQLNLVGWVWK